MVNITIDNQKISVPSGTTIMEAAAKLGTPIPKLCYLKDINEIAACRVCVVEIEGKDRLVTSCNNVVTEGMVIYTNSPKVRIARRQTVQLILSQHDCKCATCVRSGNCTLQQVANDLNLIDLPFKERFEETPWDKTFPLIRDSRKCIKCMRCIQICDKIQGLNIWDVTSTGSRTTINVNGNKKINEVSCSLCGQCITHCPVGALRERDDTEDVWSAIADKKKVVVAQVAPAVRAAWVAKKGERNMELFYGEYAGHDIDTVLTTRELTRMIRAAHIDPKSLKDRECDPLMKEWSGAGVIFGATGGVMEAALRSAHYLVTGRNPDPDAFKIVRSPSFETGVVEAEVQIGDATIRAAVVSGLGNVRKLLEAIEHGEVHYDFVEVMACPGGCVGGGGQPIHDGEELAHTRGANLYFLDKNAKIRFSHENQDVMKLYNDFLEKPLSHKSHMLLHTDHTKWEMPR